MEETLRQTWGFQGFCIVLAVASVFSLGGWDRASAQTLTYICDRPSGWAAVTGDDCKFGRCLQRAADGTKWDRDELLWPSYLVSVSGNVLTVQGTSRRPGDSPGPLRTFQMVHLAHNRAVAFMVTSNGSHTLQFFFGGPTLHWLESYYPELQDGPPAILRAFVAQCQRPLG